MSENFSGINIGQGLNTGQQQSQAQTQTLSMTPQLRQAIEILQYSNQELTDYLNQQLLENPLLEADYLPDNSLPDSNNDFEEVGVDQADLNNDKWEQAESGGSFSSGSETAWEERVSRPISLAEHLQEQVGTNLSHPIDKVIALHLIDDLDPAGYLHSSTEDMAHNLGCDIEDVEAVLGRCQTFDPIGVFARSAAECLQLQLQERGDLTPAFRALLDNLDAVANGDAKQLCKMCDVSMPELTEMIAEIRTLNPRPGLEYAVDAPTVIVPDVLLLPLPSNNGHAGGWHVELNTESLPRVLVNQRFAAQVKGNTSTVTKQTRSYLRVCKQQADFLVKSLHQRAENILKITTEIVRRQEDFFDKGVRYLKPMVLREVAEATDLHESTVSRVTMNKFMLTPRGTVPLKYFFTSSVTGITGDGVAATAVQDRIKSLIENEGKKVLSDDAIMAALDDVGITIARRTVAKYREALGIGSSVERRKQLRRL